MIGYKDVVKFEGEFYTIKEVHEDNWCSLNNYPKQVYYTDLEIATLGEIFVAGGLSMLEGERLFLIILEDESGNYTLQSQVVNPLFCVGWPDVTDLPVSRWNYDLLPEQCKALIK